MFDAHQGPRDDSPLGWGGGGWGVGRLVLIRFEVQFFVVAGKAFPFEGSPCSC